MSDKQECRSIKEIYESVILGDCCAYSHDDCDDCKLSDLCSDKTNIPLVKKAVKLHNELKM